MKPCDQFRELYEPYALGALDAGECAELREHLASGCKDCARAMDEARWLVSQLAHLAPEAEPSPMLKGRLMRAVRAEAGQTRAAPRQGSAVPWWMWAGVAALVVLSLYSGWEARRMQVAIQRLRDEASAQARTRRELEEQLALAKREAAILRDPASIQLGMPAKDAPEMRAYWHAKLGIVVAGLKIPEPAPGRALQLWLIPKAPGSKPLSAGLMQMRPDGSCIRLVPEPPISLAETQMIAITEEPAGGSPQPTSAPRWVGRAG